MLFEHRASPKSACTRSRRGFRALVEFGLACEPYESGAERFGVADGREQPSSVLTDGLANSGDVGPATARPAAMHSSSAFGQPSARELRTPRRPRPGDRDVVDISREADGALEAEIAHECLDRLAVAVVATCEHENGRRSVFLEGRRGSPPSPDERRVVLALVEVRERAHDDVAIVRSKPRSPLAPARTCARQRHAVPDDGYAAEMRPSSPTRWAAAWLEFETSTGVFRAARRASPSPRA